MYISKRETREIIAQNLNEANQEARTTRSQLEKVLDQVKTYSGTQINKRLCSHIEKTAPIEWKEIERWDSVARKEVKEQKSFPIYYTTLESNDYGNGKNYILTFCPNKWEKRESFWFKTIEELKEKIQARMEGLENGIKRYEKETEQLDTILAAYDELAEKMESFNKTFDLSGIVAACLPIVQ